MLSKTLKKHDDATELAPRTRSRSVVRLLFAVGMIVVGVLLVVSGAKDIPGDGDVLEAPSGKLVLERAVSPEDRQRGLSGGDGLDGGTGLLFVFDRPATSHCLWMKDMKISIDMVWMDEQKKVLNVAHNVSPETFPRAFCPEGEAKYALEVAAGQADVYGIKSGVWLSFDN